jgi:short subunit dehydrogenase-like uncharacterized protein
MPTKGTPIIDSCVRSSTNYCDITGEVQWVRAMIDKHHQAAVDKKIKIVNCCGFDCVPSDLGNQMMVEHILSMGEEFKVKEVKFVLSESKGGVSGGTIASLLNIIESSDFKALKSLANPYFLNPRVGGGVGSLRGRPQATRSCSPAPLTTLCPNTTTPSDAGPCHLLCK